jgi:DNA-binding phage protein
VYRCALALAATVGVTRHAVYQALHQTGSADRVGRKGVPTGRLANHRTPVSIGMHHWPSISHMARDLGVGRTYLGRKLRSAPEEVLALVMRTKG